MVEIREFGTDWIIRSDTSVVPYSAANVTRYNQSNPLFPTSRRIGLFAPEGGAACIMTKEPLGFGTYETYLIGRMDAFDPSVVAGIWTHNDLAPTTRNVEVDFEFGPWRDQNRTVSRMQLGVFVNGVRDGAHPQKVFGAPSYLYHRITLHQFPAVCRVTCAGWWELNQEWKDWAYAEWQVQTLEMGRFKIGIGPCAKDARYTLPKSASLPAKIVVAGFKFTPG